MDKTAADVIKETLSKYWFVNYLYEDKNTPDFYAKILGTGYQSGLELMRVNAAFNWQSFTSIENFTELSNFTLIEDEELISKLNDFSKKQLVIKELKHGFDYSDIIAKLNT